MGNNVQRDMRVAVSFGSGLEREVEQRIEDGTMDFEDFMKAMTLVSELKVAALGNVDSAEEAKLEAFRKIVAAMTTEERAAPALYFDDVQVGRRITRVANSSGQAEQMVERFLFQFYAMREMESRLVKGESFEDIKNDLKKGPQLSRDQADVP